MTQRGAIRVFQKVGFWIALQSGYIVMSNGKMRLIIPGHSPIDAVMMGNIARTAGFLRTNSGNFSSLLLRYPAIWGISGAPGSLPKPASIPPGSEAVPQR